VIEWPAEGAAGGPSADPGSANRALVKPGSAQALTQQGEEVGHRSWGDRYREADESVETIQLHNQTATQTVSFLKEGPVYASLPNCFNESIKASNQYNRTELLAVMQQELRPNRFQAFLRIGRTFLRIMSFAG
jgi:hypothetical protein